MSHSIFLLIYVRIIIAIYHKTLLINIIHRIACISSWTSQHHSKSTNIYNILLMRIVGHYPVVTYLNKQITSAKTNCAAIVHFWFIKMEMLHNYGSKQQIMYCHHLSTCQGNTQYFQIFNFFSSNFTYIMKSCGANHSLGLLAQHL